MCLDFDWETLLIPQIKIDKIISEIEIEIQNLNIDEKIFYFYQKLHSEEFKIEHLSWAKRFCEKKIKQLKRQRLLILYPRHALPPRVKKGNRQNLNNSD